MLNIQIFLRFVRKVNLSWILATVTNDIFTCPTRAVAPDKQQLFKPRTIETRPLSIMPFTVVIYDDIHANKRDQTII